MSGFLERLSSLYSSVLLPWTRTRSFSFTLVALLSSAVSLSSLLGWQSLQRREARKQLRDSVESHFTGGDKHGKRRRDAAISRSSTLLNDDDDDEEDEEMHDYTKTPGRRSNGKATPATAAVASIQHDREIDQEIIDEALARNTAFLGEEAMQKIRGSFVIVVGMGGVGSAAATMLVRSGIGKIRLIDFDQVTLSSLNRHSVANLSDVGTSKVSACASHFSRIAPWVTVDPVNQLFSLPDADGLLAGNPDWVIDCIDNIGTKVDLLAYCSKKGIKVFSAMGAGGKCDPTRIQIADISNTTEDGLARAVRFRLRKEGVNGGIPVVYSTERPGELGKLMPLPEEEFQKGKINELSAFDAFRVRILPVLGPLPCMFGQAIAAYLLADLAGNIDMQPLPVKNRVKLYNRMLQDLAGRDQKLTGLIRVAISESDVAYLLDDLHRGRSVVCPNNVVPARPTLIRWTYTPPKAGEEAAPVHVSNLVVMDRPEAEKHEKEVLKGGKSPEEVWGRETVELVRKRKELERLSSDYRLL